MKFLLASSLSIACRAFPPPPPPSHRAPPRHRVSSSSSSSSSSLRMASGGRMPVRPVGIGSASPRTLVTNLDLESVHDTSDEWIRTRTGISERRVLVHGGTREAVVAMEEKRRAAVVGLVDPAAGEADAGEEVEEEEGTTATTTTTTTVVPENLRSLGIEAARNALEMSGIDAGDIDLVVCATSSPDDLFGDAPSIGAFVSPSRLSSYVCLVCLRVPCLYFLLFPGTFRGSLTPVVVVVVFYTHEENAIYHDVCNVLEIQTSLSLSLLTHRGNPLFSFSPIRWNRIE